MVAHENPRVDGTFALDDDLAKSFQKPHLIFVMFEDSGLVNPPYHDVV